jgi:nucleotide-binding universal stress UspA family protein
MDQHRHTAPFDRPCRACALDRARRLHLDRLLAPLDGTVESEQALPYAAMVARWLDSEITLLHVIHPGPPFHFYRPGQVRYPDALHDRASVLASSYLSEVAARLNAAGVPARWAVASGDAAQIIPERASGGGYGLTVMAVHPHSPVKRQFSPGVLERMWRYVATPVLFLHQQRAGVAGEGVQSPAEFIVPMGGDPASSEAAPYAAALAGGSGARLTLLASLVTKRRQEAELHAGEGGSSSKSPLARMQEVAAYMRQDRIRVQVETQVGLPARTIINRQNGSPGAWVIMSSLMPHGVMRTFFGSTADGVLRLGRGPVIIVPMSGVAERRAETIRAMISEAPMIGTGR